ncbi:MAG: hypothetical protein AAGF92_13580 [Myxococcota bacterium]
MSGLRPRSLLPFTFGFTLLVGCGGGDFSGSCAFCVDGMPFGPNASQAQCTALGDALGCSEALLINEGVCIRGPDDATCTLAGCSSEIACQVVP